MGIRKFCPTRWTVRGESISSIIENYTILNLLFGLHLSERILKDTDNLSKTLQKESLSASEAQLIANHTVKT